MIIFEWILAGVKFVKSWLSSSNKTINIDLSNKKTHEIFQQGHHSYASVDKSHHETNIYLQIEDEKRNAKSLYKAAIENIKHNGPHFGDPKAPFQIDALGKLLVYDGPSQLSEQEKDNLRNYIKAAALCNGGRYNSNVRPGTVQHQQSIWLEIFDKHLSELN